MPSSPIRNWAECLMEAAGLALFMLSACAFTTLIEYPTSPLRQAITEPFTRRALMGVAMGLTAVGIIYSPWGQRSGAHLNPSVTLTFWRLGKVQSWDAIFYIVAQFGGGLGGVLLAREALGNLISDPSVNYAVTVPGVGGAVGAFLAEALISCGLMGVVLIASNTPRLARLTGFFAGALIAIYIALEAPLSGMSMNPARTFASAVPSGNWTADPETSALDVNCKAHDVDNVYVVDGSFFVSSTAVNPALTIMANALRVADHLAARLK